MKSAISPRAETPSLQAGEEARPSSRLDWTQVRDTFRLGGRAGRGSLWSACETWGNSELVRHRKIPHLGSVRREPSLSSGQYTVKQEPSLASGSGNPMPFRALGGCQTASLTTAVILQPGESLTSERVLRECGAFVIASLHYVYDKIRQFGGNPPGHFRHVMEKM